MKKNAYTLVEAMVVFAVVSVLCAVAYIVILQGRDAADSVDVRAQLTEGSRTAMREAVRDLSEANRDTVTTSGGTIPYFTDPINGETHQILVFASARGDPADGPEDGSHSNNDYIHLDSDYRPVWRSAIVYCTYVTPEGIQQLRKYVVYDNAYSQSGMFPFSVVSVTVTAITLQRGDGTGVIIPRNSGSARANYIAVKDASVTGADFTLNGSVLGIKLFLSKSELPTKGGTRRLSVTMDDSVFMRN